MRAGKRLIERYILAAIVPYTLLALVLLTTILFAQQTSRFAELLLVAHVPLKVIYKLALALLPNVLVLTVPMATLAGVLIGFSRIGGDSELIAMRAAGIGTWRLIYPVLLLGLINTAATTVINLKTAPAAARVVRQTAVQAALSKLDSPVDPRSFNAGIQGYLIYVREGDKTLGQWGKVFIFSQDAKGATRLVTARSGRIDSSAEQSELVLSDAVSTELPSSSKALETGSSITTRLAQLRLQLDTGRRALLEKLRKNSRLEPDEMSWRELGSYAAVQAAGSAQRDAATLRQKRLTLALTPFVFAVFGAGLGLRLKKGGRGLGLALSLAVMLAYYLLSLVGEQLSRAGTVTPMVGAWAASALTLSVGVWLLLTSHFGSLNFRSWSAAVADKDSKAMVVTAEAGSHRRSDKSTRLFSFPSLLDISILRALSLSFAFAFALLLSMFLVFTLFELWRFIVATRAGVLTISKYLLFLTPLISVQIMPASVLLSVLATYALAARRSEVMAWWSSGQSVYRLILPGILFATGIGIGAWVVQEQIMPEANRRQDELRAQIRGGVLKATTPVGRQWLAAPEAAGRLYAYQFNEEKNSLEDPVIYDFDAEGVHLKQITAGRSGVWVEPHTLEIQDAEILQLASPHAVTATQRFVRLKDVESIDAFKLVINNPAHLSAKKLSEYIKEARERTGSITVLTMALQAKYAEPFGCLVLALIGIPLALSFGHRNTLIALCLAIGIGLAFWSIEGGFRQLGAYGLLPVTIAAWSPLLLFASAGGYLLSKART